MQANAMRKIEWMGNKMFIDKRNYFISSKDTNHGIFTHKNSV